MERIGFLLTLRPILFGLVGMVLSGVSFPLAGVVIVRNNLIPMRYMLMHGVILGGIFSIALGVPLLPVVIVLNVVLVLVMVSLKNGRSGGLSTASTAMMVCTMGVASLLSHVFDVPAKDTLEILWGSPFALTVADLAVLAVLAVGIILYVIVFFRPVSMIFFDEEIASSLGVNVKFHNTVMVLITALIISVAMKMVGALLIDALVVLPVLGASKGAKGLRSLFVRSSVTGLVLSVVGYFCSLQWNLPVSGVLAVLAVVVYGAGAVRKWLGSGKVRKDISLCKEK